MSDPGLSALLAELWAQHAHVARARVEALQTYSEALSRGSEAPDARVTAEWEAHKLAGALGSYGRPGSSEAAALETVLRGEPDPAEVAALVAALHELVSG